MVKGKQEKAKVAVKSLKKNAAQKSFVKPKSLSKKDLLESAIKGKLTKQKENASMKVKKGIGKKAKNSKETKKQSDEENALEKNDDGTAEKKVLKKSDNGKNGEEASKCKTISGKSVDALKIKDPKNSDKNNSEPKHVDEERTIEDIVKVSNVVTTVNALKNLVEGELKTKKQSIFGDYRYCLNVSCFKIASCPQRIFKLNLLHSLANDDDDVLIVVSDLKRGSKVEFESTTEKYEDLFQEAGIKGVTIMPFNQLRNEYKSFESKRKLASTYDYYLCDGRIAGLVAGFCGNTFQNPRTTFHSVRMDQLKNLKSEISKAMRRTAYKQRGKGDLITIPVGSDKHTPEQVADNIVHVVSQLKECYPGGLDNIRSMDIKVNIRGTSSLPIYVSTTGGPHEAPYIVGPREQRMLLLKKTASQILSKFTLTKEANIIKLTKAQADRKRQFLKMRADLLASDGQLAEGDESQKEVSSVDTKRAKKDVQGADQLAAGDESQKEVSSVNTKRAKKDVQGADQLAAGDKSQKEVSSVNTKRAKKDVQGADQLAAGDKSQKEVSSVNTKRAKKDVQGADQLAAGDESQKEVSSVNTKRAKKDVQGAEKVEKRSSKKSNKS